jgi:FixJ family two-component response regulator
MSFVGAVLLFSRATPFSVRWPPKNRVAEAVEIIDSVNLDKVLNRLKTLTPREHEVLNQVVSGRLNKEIASELGITERTVKAHRKTIMEKMETKSLAELVTMIVSVRLMKPG